MGSVGGTAFRHGFVTWVGLTVVCSCSAAEPAPPAVNPQPSFNLDEHVEPMLPARPAPLSSAEQRLVELGRGEPLHDEPHVVETPKPKPPTGLTRGVGDEADRLLALGDLAIGRDDNAKALEHYRQARRLLTGHPAPIVGIVNARFGLLGLPTQYAAAPKEKRLAELFQLLDDAQKLDPNYPQLALARGRLLLVKGDAPAAETQLQKAVAGLPDDAEAISELAIALLARGDVDGALEAFAHSSELDPNNPERLTNLGTAWMLKADTTRAIEVFTRALSFAPEDPRALGNLGTALLAAGQVDSAIGQLTRAHELAPERATFMSNLGYAYHLKGDGPTAEDWCRRAVKADSKLGSAWINLGLVLAAKKQYGEAERAFKTAQKLDPTDPRALDNLEDLQTLRKSAP